MSLERDPDPKKLSVTFGDYIIPGTVQDITVQPEYPFLQGFHDDLPPRSTLMGAAFDAAPVTKMLLVFVTFLFGVLTTFLFAGRQQPDMAAIVPAQPEAFVRATGDAASASDTSPVALEQAVLASVQGDVTRSNGSDLITPAGSMSRTGPEALTMSEILLGLSPKRTVGDLTDSELALREEQDLVSRDKLEVLREGVLTGRFTVKTVNRNGKDRVCLRLPHAEISQDEAADLIEQAAARGEIDLPEALTTADGSYDADTLIFNLVQTSLANDGTAEGAEAAREMSRRAFAASAAKTSQVAGERVYLVKAGDSLAYLSLQFYGRPSDYAKIFEANRKVLNSPNKIQVGQRLIIPS